MYGESGSGTHGVLVVSDVPRGGQWGEGGVYGESGRGTHGVLVVVVSDVP